MDDKVWNNWIIATATTWDDIAPVVGETRVEAIDDGLRSLILQVLSLNQLIALLDSGQFNSALVDEKSSQLKSLNDTFSSFFLWEEKLIQKGRLPDEDKHIAEHRRILNWLNKISKDFSEGKVTVLRSFHADFLASLIRHINGLDCRTYRLENWSDIIRNASRHDDIAFLIRSMEMPDIDREHRAVLDKILGFKDDSGFYKELNAMLISLFQKEDRFISSFDRAGAINHKKDYSTVLEALAEIERQPASQDKKLKLALLWLGHVNVADYGVMVKGRWWEKVLDSANTLDDLSFLFRSTGNNALDTAVRQVAERSLKLNGVYGVLAEDKPTGAGAVNVEQALDSLYRALKELVDIVGNSSGEWDTAAKKQLSDLNDTLRYISACKSDFSEDRIAISGQIKVNVLGALMKHLNKLNINGAAASGN